MLRMPRRQITRQRLADAVETAFVGLLVMAERLNQLLEKACGARGLTHTQYNVLRILRGARPDGHPRVEITKRLIHKAPDVTRLLDRLERQGLIEREWSRVNRRHSVARITIKGLKLLDTVDPELNRLRDEFLASLTAAQVKQLVVILDRLTH